MSENELYELARKRVDRSNRRWMLLGVDILLWLVYIGVFAGFQGVIPRGIGIVVAISWMGVLVLHIFLISMAQQRDQAIEGEVQRLREAIYGEKPKRVELDEDGELIDLIEDKPKRASQSE